MANGEDFLFCEKCGIKVRMNRTECPRCLGPVVPRRAVDAVVAARQEDQARAVRAPAALAGAAVLLAIGGTWFAVGRGAAKPLVSDPITIGRPAGAVGQAARTVAAGLEVDLPVIASGADAADAFAEGDLERALAEYQAVLEQQPENVTALNNAGQILVRLERPAEAVPLLERAVAVSPDTWMLHFNLARAQGQAGIWVRAADHYRAASELMPEHYPTLFNLGLALKQSGQDAAAADALARAADADATQADPWLPLASTYERLGRQDEARQAYQKFLEKAPESPERAKVEQHLARMKGTPAEAATPRSAATVAAESPGPQSQAPPPPGAKSSNW